MLNHKDLRGVTVATVLPFDETGAIDWKGYERVLAYCAVPDTVAAVFVNGHAGEATSLSEEERTEVIRRTRAVIGKEKPLLAGVIPHGVADAIAQAKAAREAGADCYVVFPPAALGGGAASTDAPRAFFDKVTSSLDIPASVFQFPLASGFGYSTRALCEIASLKKVIAVKEGSNTMLAYEENFRVLKAAASDVAMLPSNYDWFMPQLAVGGDGLLSGLASLTPDWLSDLWRAAEAKDLASMRAASDRLHPIVRTIYGAAPLIDMHTRIKVGLKALGIIDNASPRLPLMPVAPDIEDAIVAITRKSGLSS
ncbi:dihydrodipicolinate synthase family protein [Aquamicrobium sp. LC103]|uniref:dihydrodipicolinate synthase family protein n=1 Tax=Aquamicrobium sp. LC103 TaxID=1120658 RepID=UPI00063EC85C|nr:dihydrodipicolinate synthase family protein [Aquamicrobium sp. LC103]TKT74404.1 dihydrodipicolinate synthase family protein [Aquamicrobium sp. LC103]